MTATEFPIPEAAAAALREAAAVTVLTGAGVSAESGIPTFRDALTGLWAHYRPEELATPEAFARDPALVWGWYRMRRELVARAAPNAGHDALAELERRVPDFTLVTQNVDGLHRRAGSARVVELHGNILRARCSHPGCAAAGTPLERWDEPAAGDAPPRCAACGAGLRPDVVWFGEALPADALAAAARATRRCDVFLSIGTSNVVEPAASLPWLAARGGATVLVVNPSAAGQQTGPRIHHLLGPAGRVLPALLRAAWPAPVG
ncbi:MAG TPA: NAD-dependent deacylase [Gemmatimonadales bacterium]|nr:NAD-dependent deacylase [Gemmatimonadales bacterium]